MWSPIARLGSTTLSLSAVMAATLLLSGGCASPKVYKPSELPLSFQAPAFRDPSTISLATLTPPQNKSDMIGPGYVLEISLAAGLDHDSGTMLHVRVSDDGTARLPELGQVRLCGLNEVQAEQQISASLVQRGLYQVPTVGVRIERRPTNSITVVGAVKSPGPQQVPRSASYLGAVIVAAGGFTEKAGTKVQVTRFNRDPRFVEVDLADERQRPTAGEYLDDGDVVTVEKRDLPPVQVQGLVMKPGEVDFPTNRPFRITNAISAAGGESNDLADSILIQRQRPDGQGVVLIRASLAQAMENSQENLVLAPGDAVRVERTASTFGWDLIKPRGSCLRRDCAADAMIACFEKKANVVWPKPNPNRRWWNRLETHPMQSLLRFVRAVRYRKEVVFVALAAATILGSLYYVTATRYYQSKAELLIQQTNASKEINIPGISRDAQDYMDTYRSVVLSEAVLEPALNSLSAENRVDFQNVAAEKLVEKLQKSLQVTIVRKTSILAITYPSQAPECGGRGGCRAGGLPEIHRYDRQSHGGRNFGNANQRKEEP